MKDKITTILVTLLGLALLGFTAARTLDIITLTLPSDKQLTGYLALAAFDGGLVLWSLFFMNGAKGAWQRGIAILMTAVSAIGVVAALVGDTLYHAGAAGLTRQVSPEFVEAVVWLMTAVIAANIVAVTAMHLTEPERLKLMAESDALDKIADATLAQIASSAETLAAEIAPQQAAQWVAEMRARHGARRAQTTLPVSRFPVASTPEAVPAYGDDSDTGEFQAVPAIKPSRNGKHAPKE